MWVEKKQLVIHAQFKSERPPINIVEVCLFIGVAN